MNTPLTDQIDQHWPPEVFYKGDIYDPTKLDPDGMIHSETPRCIVGEREYLYLTRNWRLSDFIFNTEMWRLDKGLVPLQRINDEEGREGVLRALREYEREHTTN